MIEIKKDHPNFSPIQFCINVSKSESDISNNVYIFRRKVAICTNTVELHTAQLINEIESGWYKVQKRARWNIILERDTAIGNTHKLIEKYWGKIVNPSKRGEYIRLSDIDLTMLGKTRKYEISIEYTNLIREMKYNVPQEYKELLSRLGFDHPLLDYNFTINIGYLANLKGYKYKVFLPKDPINNPLIFMSDYRRAAIGFIRL